MDETGNICLSSRLPHLNRQLKEIPIRTPSAHKAWAKKPRKAIPPTAVDEALPQPFKAEQGASHGTVLSPTFFIHPTDGTIRCERRKSTAPWSAGQADICTRLSIYRRTYHTISYTRNATSDSRHGISNLHNVGH